MPFLTFLLVHTLLKSGSANVPIKLAKLEILLAGSHHLDSL